MENCTVFLELIRVTAPTADCVLLGDAGCNNSLADIPAKRKESVLADVNHERVSEIISQMAGDATPRENVRAGEPHLPTESWLRRYSAPTKRTIRRQVSACRLDYAEINFLHHLLAGGPPPPIHVEPANAGIMEPCTDRTDDQDDDDAEVLPTDPSIA